MSWRSGIYEGWVRHRRFAVTPNAFRYRLFMMYLDLAELGELFESRWFWSDRRWALARFRRDDHFGDPAIPLDQAVRDLVEARLGRRPNGRIGLLTHLRYFGFIMNPVSVFFCYEAGSDRVESMVLEVQNTPWRERHLYVLDGTQQTEMNRFRIAKDFHVSPFLGMDIEYYMVITPPTERLIAHMDCRHGGRSELDATLHLRRTEITGSSLARVLCQYPVVTLKVAAGIYWQAVKLRWKRCPIFSHPGPKLPQGVS
jgi:uncharacterized protein